MKVAARYKVSSSFLARVCERMNVPTPPRGYWAQIAVGRAPKRPSLPEAGPMHELEWSRGDERGMPRGLAPKAPKERPAENAVETRRVRTVHGLIAGARVHFDKVRDSDNGYLRPYKRQLVDVYVSRDALERALSLGNRLFNAFEQRGYRACLSPPDPCFHRAELDERMETRKARPYYGSGWQPDRPTVVFVGTVAVGLTIFEMSEFAEVRYSDGVYVRADRQARTSSRRHEAVSAWTTTHDMPSARLACGRTRPTGAEVGNASGERRRRGNWKGMSALPQVKSYY